MTCVEHVRAVFSQVVSDTLGCAQSLFHTLSPIVSLISLLYTIDPMIMICGDYHLKLGTKLSAGASGKKPPIQTHGLIAKCNMVC